MTKNIVVCLDGTGNEVVRGHTNVLLTYQVLDKTDPAKQRAYYAPGVGTFVFSRTGDYTPWLKAPSRLTGLARGVGVDSNVMAAYSYIIRNYQPGDKIFLFGFSRGAFTARTLVGLLFSVGVLRLGSENLLPYLLRDYLKSANEVPAEGMARPPWLMREYSDFFSLAQGEEKSVPVEYVGLWDTVVAMGSRGPPMGLHEIPE